MFVDGYYGHCFESTQNDTKDETPNRNVRFRLNRF